MAEKSTHSTFCNDSQFDMWVSFTTYWHQQQQHRKIIVNESEYFTQRLPSSFCCVCLCTHQSGNSVEVAAVLVVAPKNPLGGVLEAVFWECGHLWLVKELNLLKIHEFLLILYVSVVCCQAHKVVYLQEITETLRSSYSAPYIPTIFQSWG